MTPSAKLIVPLVVPLLAKLPKGSTRTLPVLCPENKLLHKFECLTDLEENIPTICHSANVGFVEWSQTPYTHKISVFKRAAELLAQRKDAFVDGHLAIGGPGWFANFNVDGAIKQIEQYVACMSAPDGVIPKTSATRLALTRRRPLGPVLAISPWNAPVILGARAIAAPLAAGCSVVAKSSEKSPMLSYLLVKCFHDAGVPSEALQLVHVAPEDTVEATERFLASRHIRKVNFTGSTEVGRQIAMVAAKHLKPYLLELGGKNCAIVAKDADLDVAVPTIVNNSWLHKGQICMSTDKVYVHSDRYDDFKAKCLDVARQVCATNPDMKIKSRDSLVEGKVQLQLEDAIEKGATVLFQDPHGPTILEQVTPDMLIYSHETFGPVFSIYQYEDIDTVVDMVNSDGYGLKASIWSADRLTAIETASKIQCGGVHINGSCIHDEATIPHGGVKESGTGRFNSTWGVEEFTYIQTTTVN